MNITTLNGVGYALVNPRNKVEVVRTLFLADLTAIKMRIPEYSSYDIYYVNQGECGKVE